MNDLILFITFLNSIITLINTVIAFKEHNKKEKSEYERNSDFKK